MLGTSAMKMMSGIFKPFLLKAFLISLVTFSASVVVLMKGTIGTAFVKPSLCTSVKASSSSVYASRKNSSIYREAPLNPIIGLFSWNSSSTLLSSIAVDSQRGHFF